MQPIRLVLLALALTTIVSLAAQRDASAPRWYRGNLHTHTINSDGDSSPYDVMGWYKRHGYQFLVLTDHNTFTDPAPYDTNPSDNFLSGKAGCFQYPTTIPPGTPSPAASSTCVPGSKTATAFERGPSP